MAPWWHFRPWEAQVSVPSQLCCHSTKHHRQQQMGGCNCSSRSVFIPGVGPGLGRGPQHASPDQDDLPKALLLTLPPFPYPLLVYVFPEEGAMFQISLSSSWSQRTAGHVTGYFLKTLNAQEETMYQSHGVWAEKMCVKRNYISKLSRQDIFFKAQEWEFSRSNSSVSGLNQLNYKREACALKYIIKFSHLKVMNTYVQISTSSYVGFIGSGNCLDFCPGIQKLYFNHRHHDLSQDWNDLRTTLHVHEIPMPLSLDKFSD